MKILAILSALSVGWFWGSAVARADQAKLKIDTASGDQDTSVLIHKGPINGANGLGGALVNPPDYRLENETDDIMGDRSVDDQEAYASWDKACKAWMAQLRKDHGKRLFKVNCGKPTVDRDAKTFMKTYSSEGRYQLNVPLGRERSRTRPKSDEDDSE